MCDYQHIIEDPADEQDKTRDSSCKCKTSDVEKTSAVLMLGSNNTKSENMINKRMMLRISGLQEIARKKTG